MWITKLRIAAVVMLASCAAGIALSSPEPQSKDADKAKLEKEEIEKLQGTWVIVEVEERGEKQKPDEGIGKLIVQGDKLIFLGEDLSRAFKLDPTTKPKAIDLVIDKGEKVPGIYSLEGDQLKLAVNNKRSDERPTEFASKPDSNFAILTLRRVSKNTDPKQDPDREKTKATADRMKSANNLKQIAIAMHTYHVDKNALPAAAVYDANGKPLLSWRVMILPYIEQQALYQQFKLNEPWDSAHNKKLLDVMPKLYAPVGVKTDKPHMTFYQVFVGAGTAFEGKEGSRLQDIRDGTSNTILAVEAGEPVIWTKPDDLTYQADKPLPKLGGLFKEGFNAMYGDGSVRFIKRQFDEKRMRLAIIRNDGVPTAPGEDGQP